MEKLTLKQIIEIGKNAKIEKTTNGITVNYLKSMVQYHDEYANYYDSRIGDVSNNDDVYTAKWEYHQKQMDKFFNQLQSLKKSQTIENEIVENEIIDENTICKLPNGTHDMFLNCDSDSCIHFMNGCYWGQCFNDNTSKSFRECKNDCGRDCTRHIKYVPYMTTHSSCAICRVCVDNDKIDGDKSKFICDECQKQMEHEFYYSVEFDNEIAESLFHGDVNFDCLAHFDIMVDLELNVVTYPKHLDLKNCIGIVEKNVAMCDCEPFEFDVDEPTQQYYDLFMNYNFVGDYVDYNGTMIIAILELLVNHKQRKTIGELMGVNEL